MAQSFVILALPPPFVKKRICFLALRALQPAGSRPYLGIVLGIAAVSTASVFTRYAQQAGVPSLVIAAYRVSLASLVLAPFALLRHREELRAFSRRQWLLAATSGIFLGIHFAGWTTSLAYTSVASSVVLVSASPLFVALIAAAVLGERLTRPILAGIVLTLLGTAVVGLGSACANGCPSLATFVQGRAFTGDMLALLGAVAGAVYLSVGRVLRATVSLTSYIFVIYAMAAVVLLLAVWVARLPLAGYPSQANVWLLLLALVPQLIGHSSFNWALRYLPATYVAVTILGEPVGSTILAGLLLKEIPGPLELAGAALILAGIIIASSRSRPAAAEGVPA
jgi:drug/metabolite transporter (DMT)-like permease